MGKLVKRVCWNKSEQERVRIERVRTRGHGNALFILAV